MKFVCILIFLIFTAKAVAQETVRLLFAGDMMQHDAQIEAALQSDGESYDYSPCFQCIKSFAEEADIAVCNFEVSLAGKPYKGYPSFSAPDEFLDAIVSAGFDVFLTANNHCIDKRKKGLERTIEQMAKRNLVQLGTYTDSTDRANRYPVIVEKKGVRIAMLNYTYGTNGIVPTEPNVVNYTSKAQILTDIAKAQSMNADYIIANMHWGIEYAHEPNTAQKELGRWLIDNGVDHVIGSHPHVVQPVERYVDKAGREHLIVYSLGNVISNMTRDDSDGGILIGLELTKGDKARYNCWYTPYHVARPADCDVENYTVVPLGETSSAIPSIEIERMKAFAQKARQVIDTGSPIEERAK